MILLLAGSHIFIQNPARKLIKFCKCIFLPFLDLITPFFDFLIRWKRFKNIENRIEEIRACPWEYIFWDCSFDEQISKYDRWSTRFLPKTRHEHFLDLFFTRKCFFVREELSWLIYFDYNAKFWYKILTCNVIFLR